MKRKLRIVMTVEVEDLPDDERSMCLIDMGGEEEYGGKLPDLHEFMQPPGTRQGVFEDAMSFAEALAGAADWEDQSGLFEGSELYGQFVTQSHSVIEAEWIGEPQGERPGDRRDG